MSPGWWRSITAKLLWHTHGGQGFTMTMADLLAMDADDLVAYSDWADRQRKYEADEIEKAGQAKRSM